MHIAPFDTGKPQRYLKMAVGENPKLRAFPHTRLTVASLIRDAYTEAKEMMDAQDAWCSGASAAYAKNQKWLFGSEVDVGRYPTEEKVQVLVDVLRGDIQVHVHGYRTEDLEVRQGDFVRVPAECRR